MSIPSAVRPSEPTEQQIDAALGAMDEAFKVPIHVGKNW